MCRFIYEHRFLTSLGKYQEVWLLACLVRVRCFVPGLLKIFTLKNSCETKKSRPFLYLFVVLTV